MFARFLSRRDSDVLFISSSSVDEVWTRTTALQCHRAGLKVEVSVCAEKSEVLNLRSYHDVGIRAKAGVTFAAAADVRCDIAVTASSGLDRRIFPTRARQFIHMPHSLASLHMIYPADAFDGYDMLFAAGPQHDAEFAAIVQARRLGARKAWQVGYGKLDVLAQQAALWPCHERSAPKILVAPSWGPDNLLDRCGVSLAVALLSCGFEVVVRPHPLFFLERSAILRELSELAARYPALCIESPFDGDSAIFDADVLVGDYSGTSFEFSALRRKPVVSVDVGLKVVNPHWRELNLVPVEIACRELLGPVVTADVGAIVQAVQASIGISQHLTDKDLGRFIYGLPGECGERAAGIIGQLVSKG
jgi:YidC/Oxa1 family membrane protein insertase